jgi:thiamine pyrophosphokinase
METKRAVIFANGEMPDEAAIRARLRPGDWIVAADGGTRHALACGRVPNLIIGDLDSLPPGSRKGLERQGVQMIVHPADKNETDLELALLEVAANQVGQVLVVGALGGRLDQMLANIQLLSRPELAHLDVEMTDGHQHIHLVRPEVTIEGKPGDLVSLLPLCQSVEGVKTQGLEWPLDSEVLHFGHGRGVSNRMIDHAAHVQVKGGLLLCIHADQHVSEVVVGGPEPVDQTGCSIVDAGSQPGRG